MPLTPADVHNVAFKKPAIGKRGYDEEDVDAFLDEVEQELIRLLEENRALHDQMQRPGPGGPAASGPGNRALEAELSDLTAQLGRLQEARARAEQNARSMQTQLERARRETPAAPAPSAADGDSPVLMMARRTADDHMRDARSEADAVISAAQAESDKLSTDAQLTAGTIESDARRKHTEAMNTLGDKRAELLNEIDKLGRLAQTYQQALGDHVTRQLQELDSTSGRELD
ncbi:DivIVA domain-containing protein [Actinoplanes solisilvae]|uniref:DivIVA domain-containing protein n=1 Tax=Actinoplanes solisilvae TaxID=2486853 RepID=UPI000FD9532A|nr:DivIVA domain-containing protein [Actinoplanes solisilvae]